MRFRNVKARRVFWLLAGFTVGTLWLLMARYGRTLSQLDQDSDQPPGSPKEKNTPKYPAFQGKIYNLEGPWDILPDNDSPAVERLIAELRNQTQDMKEQQWLNIQFKRRQAIKRYCNEHKELDVKLSNLRRRDIYNFYKIVLLGAKHKALYCPVGKVACTSWKTAMAMLQGHYDGLKPGEHIHDQAVLARNDIKPLTQVKNAEAVITTYPIFLFVRHPFERLVSAFKNKFQAENKENLQLNYGIGIMKKYRDGPLTEKEAKTGWGVKFPEFIKWLLDENIRNVHWDSFNDICHLCSVQYTFIGKMDTFEVDKKFILKHMFETKTFDKFPHSNPSPKQSKSNLEDYFKLVPQEDINRLLHKYDIDFKMFGYTWPQDSDI